MSDNWVYVGGTFDLFHPGHVNFLKKCSEFGKVVVALNTDEFAARYKRQPILSIDERYDLVASCRYVDDVAINVGNERSSMTIDGLLLSRNIKSIAHGDDWTGESLMSQLGIDQEWIDRRGISMLYIPYTAGISTSDIIGRINGEHHRGGNCSCGLGRPSSHLDGSGKADAETR